MAEKITRQQSSYQDIKNQNQARENYAQIQADRKRNALVLFMQYLRQENYINSVRQIEQETNISLDRFEVCDNIDILSILAEYETYYEYKYNKQVKLVKKLKQDPDQAVKKAGVSLNVPGLPKRAASDAHNINENKNIERPKSSKTPKAAPQQNKQDFKVNDILPQINAKQISNDQVKKMSNENQIKNKDIQETKPEEQFCPMLMPPPTNFPPELLSFYYIIQHEILTEHPTQSFQEVIGLEKPKQILRESVILPAKYPDLFQGILKPWKGCLLFSAPGNGKSFLARALASECKCTFFNISASSLLSKYYGESEKLVRCLFLMARQYERSVIFIDELDCLMTSRSDGDSGGNEHEASRRIKTQLLVEIDGLASNISQNNEKPGQVFVLAATNLPWTIDSAMLRRLEKRVYVNSPNFEERKQIIIQQIGDKISDPNLFVKLAEKTENWSASDVCAICKEAAMHKLRRVLDQLESGQISENQVNLNIDANEIEAASQVVKPSYDIKLQDKYLEWAHEYGA